MYNRYIPQEEDYIPVVPPPENPPPSPPRADRAGGQSAPGSSVLSALSPITTAYDAADAFSLPDGTSLHNVT